MVWQIFDELPPEAQQQVVDLIISLENQYIPATRKTKKHIKRRVLVDEPFIGMWRDRDDIKDSSAWVRQIRECD
ncbi:MAG: DUF2281 domain-containing protein [Chloroflexi bacterium]|nr:DUF2281 domain-containing protein [Chloroflexota bacterium]